MVRKIDTALDLSWLRSERAPHYSSMGRPSINPELMIRILVAGYVFAMPVAPANHCDGLSFSQAPTETRNSPVSPSKIKKWFEPYSVNVPCSR